MRGTAQLLFIKSHITPRDDEVIKFNKLHDITGDVYSEPWGVFKYIIYNEQKYM